MIEWFKIQANDSPLDAIGLAISLVGFTATLITAILARTSADAAKRAAEAAQRNFSSIDTFDAIAQSINLLTQLSKEVKDDDWKAVSTTCINIRRVLAPLAQAESDIVSKDFEEQIALIVGEIRSLEETSNKVSIDENRPPKKTKIILSISDSIENLSVASVQAKLKLGVSYGES